MVQIKFNISSCFFFIGQHHKGHFLKILYSLVYEHMVEFMKKKFARGCRFSQFMWSQEASQFTYSRATDLNSSGQWAVAPSRGKMMFTSSLLMHILVSAWILGYLITLWPQLPDGFKNILKTCDWCGLLLLAVLLLLL